MITKKSRVGIVGNMLIAEARLPQTTWTRLKDLAKHPLSKVRRAVLDNPNVCPLQENGKLKSELLIRLAKEFPEEVAAHPFFVLHALIEPNQEMVWVVKEVVERTKDVGLIEHVFRTWGTSSPSVRLAMARNQNTPVEILRVLGNEATETNWSVRELVASNPNTPPDVLRVIGNQKTESQWVVRKLVVLNPNATEDILRTLGNQYSEPSSRVRIDVASNQRAPVDILRTLGNEKTESEWWVREAVAKNPSTPVEILRNLSKETTEPEKFVREAAQYALLHRGLT